MCTRRFATLSILRGGPASVDPAGLSRAGRLMPGHAVNASAAAIETKAGTPANRPCVVVAGGREPPHWEAYPHHLLHRALLRAWRMRRSRLFPWATAEHCCVDVVGDLPRCMDLITADDVIRAIEIHFQGGAMPQLFVADK